MHCRICGNNNRNIPHIVKEMMYGSMEDFKYIECAECGCLQLEDIPADMSKYYPYEYYSFSTKDVHLRQQSNFIKRTLEYKRTHYIISQNDFVGYLVSIIKPPPPYLLWMKKCNATFDSRILDIGCGAGHLLGKLRRAGFRDLTGIDIYIKRELINKNWISIYKKEIFEVNEKYDIIIFNHSFEHMSEPLKVLHKASKILNDKGELLIRIPTVTSEAWKRYGVNWVGIDAPRHLFIHSLKSINMLATEARLWIKDIVYDVEDVHYWGSEQYKKGIPLTDERSVCVNPSKSIFTKQDIKNFPELAKDVGGQISVFLTKA